jgi:thiol-disulfide isomerase/thioredoxin
MQTSRLTLAFLASLALPLGCMSKSSAPADSPTAQNAPVDEGKKEAKVASADPAAGVEPETEELSRDDAPADAMMRAEKDKTGDVGGGSAPPPSPKPDAASTDIVTVADAGAGSKGREPQVGGEIEAPAEADPDEKSEDERPPLPKPIFGDTEKSSCRVSMQVGNKLKSFKLPSLDGKKTISSSGYRGRVVLVNFWATWCKPCIKELPDLDRLYRKYRNNGMTFVAVATDEEAEGVQKIVDDLKLAAKIAIAGEAAAAAYDHPNFPFSFVVDGDGKIVAAYEAINESCLADLESVLRDQLEGLD